MVGASSGSRQKELPELSFDIYGKGGEEGKLRSLIDELGAADYIHLKGHANLEEIYKNYEGLPVSIDQ